MDELTKTPIGGNNVPTCITRLPCDKKVKKEEDTPPASSPRGGRRQIVTA